MKLQIPNQDQFSTPIYVKTSDDMPWPEDKVFYLLTADGCMICRNHAGYRSSAPAKGLPTELAEHPPFVELLYPRLAQEDFERVVGFFSVIEKRDNSECYAMMVLNKNTGLIEIMVPPQEVSYGSADYTLPKLAPHLTLIGDIHSHVNMQAYSSMTDEKDEKHKPGVHIVVGRISQEPPEFHVEVVVDGTRFTIDSIWDVVEGYTKRCNDKHVPKEWVENVSKNKWTTYYGGGGNYASWKPKKKKHRSESGLTAAEETERQRLERWLEERGDIHYGDL